MKKGRSWVATTQLVTAMALAGSSVVVGKHLAVSLPVYLTTFATLLVALLVMLPCAWRRWGEIRVLGAREWWYVFLQGLCGIVLFRVLMLHGLRTVDAAQAGVITGASPAVLTLLSWLLLGERISLLAGAGVLCAMGGAIGLGLVGVSTGGGAGTAGGIVLVFGAVVSEGLFSIWRKRIAAEVSATANTFTLIFCALLALAPMALHDLLQRPAPPTATEILAIVYYGAVATVAAYLLWTGAVGSVSGVTAGIATAAMPAAAVLLAAGLLGEPLRRGQLFACLLVVLGIVAGAWSARGGGGQPKRGAASCAEVKLGAAGEAP